MLDWVFHDRTDDVKKNAFGCLFRYITVGLSITEDMSLQEFFKELTDRSNNSLAHASYEWSVKKDNVFEHDMMIACYETSDIMSTHGIESIGGTKLYIDSHAPVNSRSLAIQIIENVDGILPLLMFNQGIYSEEKINKTIGTFTRILDQIMNTTDPSQVTISQVIE